VIVRFLGQLARAAARLRRGEAGADLRHVGEELARLEARRSQRAPTSR